MSNSFGISHSRAQVDAESTSKIENFPPSVYDALNGYLIRSQLALGSLRQGLESMLESAYIIHTHVARDTPSRRLRLAASASTTVPQHSSFLSAVFFRSLRSGTASLEGSGGTDTLPASDQEGAGALLMEGGRGRYWC